MRHLEKDETVSQRVLLGWSFLCGSVSTDRLLTRTESNIIRVFESSSGESRRRQAKHHHHHLQQHHHHHHPQPPSLSSPPTFAPHRHRLRVVTLRHNHRQSITFITGQSQPLANHNHQSITTLSQ